jgi:hypothetical protein
VALFERARKALKTLAADRGGRAEVSFEHCTSRVGDPDCHTHCC